MKFAPLTKKLMRDLWHLKTQVLAIAVVISSGVALYVTMLGTMASLDETMTAYYERYRFADVFANVKRAPRTLRDSIALIDGVATVEDRISASVTIDVPGGTDPVLGQVLSLPHSGRPQRCCAGIPGRPAECRRGPFPSPRYLRMGRAARSVPKWGRSCPPSRRACRQFEYRR